MNHQHNWDHASKGDPLWLSDPDEGYIEATLVSVQQGGEKVIVETKDGKRYTVDAGQSSNANASSSSTGPPRGKKSAGATASRRLLPRSNPQQQHQHHYHKGIENMDEIHPLNEATILCNIEHRFRLDYIYTRTGPLLLALNPFKWLPIYGEEIVRQYHRRPYGSLPPHCYQEAEDAYQQLQQTQCNQAVVICGESGAGKTETTKLMLQYIRIVARGIDENGAGAGAGAGSGGSSSRGPSPVKPRAPQTQQAPVTIGEKLVASNPLMESFGNSKTLRNNNSSRFGKFTLLHFHRPEKHKLQQQLQQHHQAGTSFPITGGRVSNFLLEKSRVTRQPQGERNYHVFYQLLAGASQELRKRLHLPLLEGEEEGDRGFRGGAGGASAGLASLYSSFHYLAQSGCTHVEGMNDAEDFAATKSAMDAVGITREEQDALFQLVAGVLHLGNVEFDGSTDGESSTVAALHTAAAGAESSEETEAQSAQPSPLKLAAELLGLDPEALAEAITTRVRQLPGNKTVRSPQTVVQSRDSRDALAKAIYSRLFDNLVARINAAFDRDHSKNPAFIGILDIFGFESFEDNAFEQLLVNFTNEKLQLLFNNATFQREEEEYLREQIEWDKTDFPDNQPCVDLIEKKPMGLLPVLDSECTRGAAANDAGLVSTYNKSFKEHPHYSICGPSTPWRKCADGMAQAQGGSSGRFTEETDFVVHHYAGPVIYSSQEFVDKNRDAFFDHVNTLMASASSNSLITLLFQGSSSSSSLTTISSPSPTPGSSSSSSSRDDNGTALRAGSATVSQRFTTQLNSLLQTLQECNCRFVRCIKTNHLLEPQIMDKPGVLKQLVCSGVMAALEVRRAGFPTRVAYADFVEEFRVFGIDSSSSGSSKDQEEGPQAVVPKPSSGDAEELIQQRALTARMMMHPAVRETVTTRQYRLGLTKIFLQADSLMVLQGLKNRFLLPKIVRLQKWWVRLSESALAHKLNCMARTLRELEAKVDMAGVHRLPNVQRALEDCAAAVLHARGLGSLAPEIFRPAVTKACQKVQATEEVVARALALKERDAEQRAELLELLDSGRARLGHVQRALAEVTMEGEARARVTRLLEKANRNLSEQSAHLLRLANRQAQAGGGAKKKDDNNEKEVEEEMEGHQNPDERLRRQRRKVEMVLTIVTEVEVGFERLQLLQGQLNEARSAAQEQLARVKKELRYTLERAETAGILELPHVQQPVADAKEQLKETKALIAKTQELGALEPAVDKLGLCVSELAQLVQVEARRKEDEDRRKQGQSLWEAASAKLTELKAEVERVGLLSPSAPLSTQTAVTQALASLDSELAAVAILQQQQRTTTAGSHEGDENAQGAQDDDAYLEGCQALASLVETVEATLRTEKRTKQQHEQLRGTEVARLAPMLRVLQAIQVEVQSDFALAAEVTLCKAVAASLQEVEDLQASLRISPAVAALREQVDGALRQGATAERLFADVKQRHERRARELAVAKTEYDALVMRFQNLLKRYGLGGPSKSNDVLLALCDADINRTRELMRAFERKLRVGEENGEKEEDNLDLSISPSSSSTTESNSNNKLRAAVQSTTESIGHLESSVQVHLKRLAAVEKVRQDEKARLLLAQTRFQAFLAETTEKAAAMNTVLRNSSSFLDKARVREAINATKEALRVAEEKLSLPVTAAWLKEEQTWLAEERQDVNKAMNQVTRTETLVEEERVRHEAWYQQCNASQADLDAARKKFKELETFVIESRLSSLRTVQSTLEACRCAQDLANKLSTQAQRIITTTATAKDDGDDNGIDQKDEDALLVQMERAIASFAEQVRQAEASFVTCKTRNDADEAERASLHARFAELLVRFEGTVAMVEAAGPTVKKLCLGVTDDATAAISQAKRLFARGGGGGGGGNNDEKEEGTHRNPDTNKTSAETETETESGEASSASIASSAPLVLLQPLATAVLKATKCVDLLETEAETIRNQVDRATAFKLAECQTLASLRQSLQTCAEKAETHGLLAHLSPVEAALSEAQDKLATLAVKLEQGAVESWMDDLAALPKEMEALVMLTATAEEVVDQEVTQRSQWAQDRETLRATWQTLRERHDTAASKAKDTGIKGLTPVQQVLEAAEVELATFAVPDALELSSWSSASLTSWRQRLEALTKRVVSEEEVVATETRRLQARETHVKKAASDLGLLVDRMARLEGTLKAHFKNLPSAAGSKEYKEEEEEESGGVHGDASTTSKKKKKKKKKEEEETEAEADAQATPAAGSNAAAAQLPIPPLHVQTAAQEAKAALWEVQRFVREGLQSRSLPLPSTDTVMKLVHLAEEEVAKHLAHLDCRAQQRADALTRLRFLERKCADVAEDAAVVGMACDISFSFSSSSSSATVTSSQGILMETVAAAQAALLKAQRSLSSDEEENQQQEPSVTGDATSADAVSTSSFVALLEDAAVHVDRAAELLEREKVRAAKEEHERLVAVRSLDQQQDCLSRLRIMAEARGLNKASRTVEEVLQAAEHALGVVTGLLEGGQLHVSARAFDVAVQKVKEAEEVILWEKERQVRHDRQCRGAQEELVRLRLRSQALRQVVAEVDYLSQAVPVADRLAEVDKALARAAMALEGAAALSLMTLQTELRLVARSLEAAEREIRRTRIYQEEKERYSQQQAEEARLRAAWEVEEERRHGELEKQKRSQLEVELEKLTCRLALHRPTLDSIQSNMAKAEEAVKSARVRLQQQEGGAVAIAEAEAAAESALNLTAGLEQTVSSYISNSGSNSNSNSTANSCRSGSSTISSRTSSRSSLAGAATNGGGGGGGGIIPSITEEEDREEGLVGATTTRATIRGPSMDSSSAVIADAAAATSFQSYMDTTTTTLTTVARSVEALTQGMADLQSSVQQQWRVLAAQKEIIISNSAGNSPADTLKRRGAGADGADSPSTRHSRPGLSVDVSHTGTRLFASTSSAAAPPVLDEIGRSTGGHAKDREEGLALREEKHRPQDEKKQAQAPVDGEDILQLLSKHYSDDIYDLLKDLKTSGGITLQDCIASGSYETDTLEVFAGDYESFKIFAPLFEPVIQACHPLYQPQGQQQQPRDLDSEHLRKALGAEAVVVDGEKVGHARMVRLMVSRNLKGQNFTPKMSVKQLRQVEKAVVRAMNDLLGEFQGTYTTFADLAQDKTLQVELEEAELPQPWRLAETAGMLSSWPEGRGVFLNKDRSLCIFVNMEDHVTVMSTISGNGAGDGSDMAQRAFALAYKALETLTARLEFESDDRLGYITPSPAKLGTGLAFSLSLSTSSAAPQSLFEDVERRFQVCVDRAGTPRDGGGKTCLVFSELSLGVSEVDIIKEVVQASRFLLSSLSETKASS